MFGFGNVENGDVVTGAVVVTGKVVAGTVVDSVWLVGFVAGTDGALGVIVWATVHHLMFGLSLLISKAVDSRVISPLYFISLLIYK